MLLSAIDLQLVLIVSILFLAASIRTVFGFGDALIAMPALTLVLGFETAAPLVALTSGLLGFLLLMMERKAVRRACTCRLVLSSLAGIPLGLLLLKKVAPEILYALFGTTLVTIALLSIFRPFARISSANALTAYLFGLLGGVMGGAFNSHGPPVVIYGLLRHWKENDFQATLQGYLLPTSALLILFHFLSGLYTPKVFHLFFLALPALIIAFSARMIIGTKQISSSFVFATNIFLIGSGLSLLGKAIALH